MSLHRIPIKARVGVSPTLTSSCLVDMYLDWLPLTHSSVFLQPERISGEQYGIHSDVWSLGISFMEVCSSHCLYIDAAECTCDEMFNQKNIKILTELSKPVVCDVRVSSELHREVLHLVSLSSLQTLGFWVVLKASYISPRLPVEDLPRVLVRNPGY